MGNQDSKSLRLFSTDECLVNRSHQATATAEVRFCRPLPQNAPEGAFFVLQNRPDNGLYFYTARCGSRRGANNTQERI
jgi:hypothetical protein